MLRPMKPFARRLVVTLIVGCCWLRFCLESLRSQKVVQYHHYRSNVTSELTGGFIPVNLATSKGGKNERGNCHCPWNKLSLTPYLLTFSSPKNCSMNSAQRCHKKPFPKCFADEGQAIVNQRESCLFVMLTSHQYHLFRSMLQDSSYCSQTSTVISSSITQKEAKSKMLWWRVSHDRKSSSSHDNLSYSYSAKYLVFVKQIRALANPYS